MNGTKYSKTHNTLWNRIKIAWRLITCQNYFVCTTPKGRPFDPEIDMCMNNELMENYLGFMHQHVRESREAYEQLKSILDEG